MALVEPSPRTDRDRKIEVRGLSGPAMLETSVVMTASADALTFRLYDCGNANGAVNPNTLPRE
jgi:hypothetical protein